MVEKRNLDVKNDGPIKAVFQMNLPMEEISKLYRWRQVLVHGH